VRRLAHRTAEAKGDASEDVWLELLADDLPHRYRVTKGTFLGKLIALEHRQPRGYADGQLSLSPPAYAYTCRRCRELCLAGWTRPKVSVGGLH
jgi:hypothetical protein